MGTHSLYAATLLVVLESPVWKDRHEEGARGDQLLHQEARQSPILSSLYVLGTDQPLYQLHKKGAMSSLA